MIDVEISGDEIHWRARLVNNSVSTFRFTIQSVTIDTMYMDKRSDAHITLDMFDFQPDRIVAGTTEEVVIRMQVIDIGSISNLARIGLTLSGLAGYGTTRYFFKI